MPDPVAPVPAPDPFRPPAADPFRPPRPQERAAVDLGGTDSSAGPPVSGGSSGGSRGAKVVGAALLAVVAVAVAALALAVVGAPRPALPPVADHGVRPAPPLQLTDQNGQPFTLSSELGRPVLVFFGYTHCPDVCPATIGTINEALAKAGGGARAVFVSIDPERDDVAAMHAYLKYLPTAYTGLTGTPAQVRQNADAWGVKYAKQLNTTGGYGMAHTADVFLVDAQGRLRTTFPFGTTADPMADALRTLLAETPPPPDAPSTAPIAVASPAPAASVTPAASPVAPAASLVAPATTTPTTAPSPASALGLQATLVSSEVWAGGPDPVILTITDAAGIQLDGTEPVDVTVTGAGDAAAAPPVRAVAVKPWGEKTVYFVATVTIPSPGGWQLALSTPSGGTGSIAVQALAQGATTPLGAPAPNIHTPTLADVGGVAEAVTTQPQPDLRLSQTSTSDARAQGRPYVIVIDSARFRVSPLCGKAITMVRYLIDRWQDSVDFVHLEPFVYTIVTDEPVLSGDISQPPLNQWTTAWGIGQDPWGAKAMPWAFVVDGQGVVRAKYTGIIGSADLDVIISLIEGNGVVGG
jgi:protein SCO1/2